MTAEEKKQLARLRRRAAKRGLEIHKIKSEIVGGDYYAFVNISVGGIVVYDSPRTNDLDEFERVLDELDAQDAQDAE